MSQLCVVSSENKHQGAATQQSQQAWLRMITHTNTPQEVRVQSLLWDCRKSQQESWDVGLGITRHQGQWSPVSPRPHVLGHHQTPGTVVSCLTKATCPRASSDPRDSALRSHQGLGHHQTPGTVLPRPHVLGHHQTPGTVSDLWN